MMADVKKERSAGIILFRDSSSGIRHYLLLNYGRYWDLPKGHVEAGETDIAAAARELREETGIVRIQFIPGFRREIRYYYRQRSELVHKTVIFFLARTKASRIRLSSEHESSEWLTYSAALERLTFATARDLIRKAEAALSAEPTPAADSRDDSASGNGY